MGCLKCVMKKKKEGLSRLLEIAGEKKSLLFFSGLLSAISALCALVPFWAIYEILKELLIHAADLSAIGSVFMVRWGWLAFAGLVMGVLFLYASLMSSHIAAFRILYGLKMSLSDHLGQLSLGYLNSTSVGCVKKIMEQNVEKIEHFIAHTIPDIVNVLATIIFMFIIFFSLNGWMALTALACIFLSLGMQRSEEHTSELQSRQYLVCRLLLEKKKKQYTHPIHDEDLFFNLPTHQVAYAM